MRSGGAIGPKRCQNFEVDGGWPLKLPPPPGSDKLRWDGSSGLGRLPVASGQLYHCLAQTCRVKIVQPTEQKPHWKKPKLGPASLTLPEKSSIMAGPRQTLNIIGQILLSMSSPGTEN